MPEATPAEPSDKTAEQETPKTFSQEEVNALLAKQKREQFGDYSDLKRKAGQFDEITEQAKTQQQRDAEALSDANKRLAAAEAATLRLEIAAEKGLTPAQAKRLVGSTREELETDATELLDTFKTPSEPAETTPDAAAVLDLGTRGSTTAVAGDPAADFANFLKRELA